jgi:hypothetical protein
MYFQNKLTRRVECGKEVDKECNKGNTCTGIRRHKEATSSSDKAPGHVGEREKQQISTAKRVDLVMLSAGTVSQFCGLLYTPDSRKSEYELLTN